MFPINKELNKVDAAFGGTNVIGNMPKMNEIPDEFKKGDTEFNKIVTTWFFKGLPAGTVFSPKEGVDRDQALVHLSSIIVSFAPKHEHKEASVAYLMSQWFDKVEMPEE